MKFSSSCFFLFTILLPAPDLGAEPAAIVAAGATVEKLAGGLRFTEGPVWIPKENRLVFSDIPTGRQMEWSEQGGLKEWRKVERSNGNLLDLQGRLLSCQHAGRNVIRTEKDGTITVLASTFEGRKFNSPNDLAIRSDGTIWFTDPTYGQIWRPNPNKNSPKKPVGIGGKWVFRLKPDGAVSVACKTIDMPNGIVFSPDEKRVYISDTGTGARIRVYDVVEEGLLGEPLFTIDVRSDGMCVDTEGRVYTTTPAGIQIFTKDGKQAGVIKVPEQPANVCFGGDGFDTLYITARKGLYRVKTTAKGQVVR